MSLFETDYLNYLMAGYAKSAIAFDSKDEIRVGMLTSLWGYANIELKAESSFTSKSKEEALAAVFNKHRLRPLLDFLFKEESQDGDQMLAVANFKLICALQESDFFKNPYAAKYLLSQIERVLREGFLSFLGSDNEIVATLKSIASGLEDTLYN